MVQVSTSYLVYNVRDRELPIFLILCGQFVSKGSQHESLTHAQKQHVQVTQTFSQEIWCLKLSFTNIPR